MIDAAVAVMAAVGAAAAAAAAPGPSSGVAERESAAGGAVVVAAFAESGSAAVDIAVADVVAAGWDGVCAESVADVVASVAESDESTAASDGVVAASRGAAGVAVTGVVAEIAADGVADGLFGDAAYETVAAVFVAAAIDTAAAAV